MQNKLPQLFAVAPMECKEVRDLAQIPTDKSWQYEVKLDGYRCIATCWYRDVALYSRNKLPFHQFADISMALMDLREQTFIVDGEIVALDKDGRSDFNALQHARSAKADLHYYIFDLLHLNGKDLYRRPLEERQNLLWDTFPRLPPNLHFVKPLPAKLSRVIEQIQKFGFEGIVAKRKDSLYEPGGTPGTWLKRKLKQSDEFIIGGYIPGPSGVHELVVGKKSGRDLLFVDSVKNGFVPRTRKQVFEAITKLENGKCPFANLPERPGRGRMDREKMAEVRWIKPRVVVEIAMNEWTPGKHLRHSEFRRLRPDKTAREVSSLPTR